MTVAGATAGRVGSAPTDGAIHQGTTPGSLDTSQGLVSAEGGEVLHPLEFAGSEVTPTPNSSGVALEEPNAGPGAPTTVWMSHPSNLGYARSTSGSTSAETPSQDSGTSNGSSQDELTRVKNFNGGATQNPTSNQAATTSRAQRRGAGGGPDQMSVPPPEGNRPISPFINGGGVYPNQAAIEMNNTFGWLLGPYPTSPGSGSPAGGGGPVYDSGNGRATGTYQQGPGGSLGGPQPTGPPPPVNGAPPPQRLLPTPGWP